MRKIKNTNTMIERLNDKFDNLRACNESYFTGAPKPSKGIWLKGFNNINSIYLDSKSFEQLLETPHDEIMPAQAVEAFLESHGWMIEPYDSGTSIAWPAQ